MAAAAPGPWTPTAPLTLIGKPGCHLCDTVRTVVLALAEEFGVGVEEVSIRDHPDLAAAYGEMIPVTLLDGAVHDYWRIDADRLRAALVRRL
ncbi:Glutaredoxin-like protein (fragment) [Nostocoides australiense Ben110]|uniref:Glutaredoxin-like protein n=1 Tax=Nostocoides australiense Ben110 TaxID=1193182 RepID=W6K4W7_9MICO